jgi:RNA polymerase sigma-70 factor, ECF subfamily
MSVAEEAGRAGLTPAVSETAERLFREHSGWIYGYCLRLLRSPEEAEDALQTTYLNACRSLSHGFEPRADSAWLLRITQNACLTRLRSSGRRASFELVDDTALVTETLAAPDDRSEDLIGLSDALASLPERQRRAILLREWQGLPYREVAQRLGLTQGAVETLIFRARRALAAALENPATRIRSRSALTLDLGGLLTALKAFIASAAGVQTLAVALVAATGTIVATDPAHILFDRSGRTAPASAEGSPAPSPTPSPAYGEDVRERGMRPPSGKAVSAGAGARPDRSLEQKPPSIAEPEPTAAPEPTSAPERTARPERRGNAHGEETAEAAKGKPKANRGNGRPLGPAKQRAGPLESPGGQRAAPGGKPESGGQGGPPPKAQADRRASGKAPKSS